MSRIDHWEVRLDQAIQDTTARPYSLGDADCFANTADIVQAITEKDIISEWRGQYDTLMGAARVIKNADYDGVADWLDTVTDTRIEPAKAQRGDIVARGLGRAIPSLGICIGDKALLFVHNVGAIYKPMKTVEAAWRV